MGQSKNIRYEALDTAEAERVIQAIEVLYRCFSDGDRYTVSRLTEELKQGVSVFYKQFFVAVASAGDSDRVVGVGGVKAADWASNTHILYLSAVHPEFRNRGIGKGLVKVRTDWVREHHDQGRILVSTAKIDRFKQLGFRSASKTCDKDRSIMIYEF